MGLETGICRAIDEHSTHRILSILGVKCQKSHLITTKGTLCDSMRPSPTNSSNISLYCRYGILQEILQTFHINTLSMVDGVSHLVQMLHDRHYSLS